MSGNAHRRGPSLRPRPCQRHVTADYLRPVRANDPLPSLAQGAGKPPFIAGRMAHAGLEPHYIVHTAWPYRAIHAPEED
jgi:hypothetical protein